MKWPSLERPIQTPKQLLVEGRTPEIFFREYVEALKLENQWQVRDFLSLSDLTDFLKLFHACALSCKFCKSRSD